jgi:hypothetical protein
MLHIDKIPNYTKCHAYSKTVTHGPFDRPGNGVGVVVVVSGVRVEREECVMGYGRIHPFQQLVG